MTNKARKPRLVTDIVIILANVSLRSLRLFCLKSLNEKESENHLPAEQRVVGALQSGVVSP